MAPTASELARPVPACSASSTYLEAVQLVLKAQSMTLQTKAAKASVEPIKSGQVVSVDAYLATL